VGNRSLNMLADGQDVSCRTGKMELSVLYIVALASTRAFIAEISAPRAH
jgi:hypothetical protein